MNGAIAELDEKMIRNPIRARRMIIGMSHHNFLCQRKARNSPRM
jgi:hypothetical protein